MLVIDPLISAECAAAALALYREHRGDRPVTGLLYTHSHVDHFGGARGVVSRRRRRVRPRPGVRPGRLPGARHQRERLRGRRDDPPRHLHVRRAAAEGPGRPGRRRPGADDLDRDGDADPADRRHHPHRPGGDGRRHPHGVPAHAGHRGAGGDELPASPTGGRCAWPRTPPTTCTTCSPCAAPWSATRTAGPPTSTRRSTCSPTAADVLFAQHHWPRWGTDRIVDFLAKQRDLYGYIHDQALRLMNKGYVGAEIAEQLELPPSLEREWHCRGYYGSLNHNLKAVYQRYLGWFDGNPAHLWPHPPEAAGERYVDAGRRRRRAARARARRVRARRLPLGRRGRQPPRLRRPRQRRGQGAAGAGARAARLRRRERDLAQLLPDGRPRAARTAAAGPPTALPPDFIAGLTNEQLFDALAIQIDGPRAGDRRIALHWRFTDTGERVRAHAAARRSDPPPRRPRGADRRHGEHRAQRAERGRRRLGRRSRSSSRPGDWRSRATRQARRAARPARPARPGLRDRHAVSDQAGTPDMRSCTKRTTMHPRRRRWRSA